MTSAPSARSSDSSDEDRRRIGEEIAGRLRRNGVQLSGTETSEELADLEEAVEHFERMVERGSSPIAPDEPDFVLPTRKPSELVSAYIKRVQEAGSRAGQKGGQR